LFVLIKNPQHMENKQNNSGLKAAVVILALLLLGSIGYIFKMSSDNSKQVTELTSEKDQLANDLKARIAELDLAISENTALKADFEAQKEEMTNLLAELEKSKGDAASLRKYRDSYNKLKREMDNLLAENKLLKEQNVALTSSLDSTKVVLQDTKRYADTLLTQNDNLTKTVEKGSTLAVLNLNVLAVKERSSGKQIETDKARRADKLKVSFLIAENQIAKSGDRTYYVQIIDSKNNILGDKETITISPELTLTYSFITKVKYENKTVQVNEEVAGKDFAAGTYFVNVFNQKGEMVSKTSFSLR
jgi:outer membrane murein-binding lipoprotein Lpp